MTIIPAIDLINGQCVRLFRGDYGNSTVYNDDPVKTAESFVEAGAGRIHIVDLDAARGTGNNRDVIRKIKKEVNCIIETGGGIRTDEDVDELIDCGIDRLIAGTVLAKDPDRVAGWVARYGRRFIAGIDALDGEVKVSGWEKGSGIRDTELARTAAGIGILSIIYTNIAKDGTLSGPDIDSTVRIASESGLPVILSGGISSASDIAMAAEASSNSGIRGVITGKAVYEGKINLAELFAEYGGSSDDSTGW